MNTIKTHQRIVNLFEKLVYRDKKIRNAHLLIHSNTYQLHLNLARGDIKSSIDDSVMVGQPVYMASVGKLFTAVLIGMLCDQGKITFRTRIADLLTPDLINHLHVFKKKDYTSQIQLHHLLNHTAGLPDYFEDKPAKGPAMMKRILNEPDLFFQPEEVITWTKENLKSKFSPGQRFHYSDTGYLLLGLAIEAVTGMPFHNLLGNWIFEPLGMQHSFIIGHSLPLQANSLPLAGVYAGDNDITGYRSLGIDHAGGGITAPLEDLLIFIQALAQGRLLSEQTFRIMNNCIQFSPGIDYGYGIMKIRPVPILVPSRYTCWGNAGSTGSFMFFHPGLDTYLIGSLNQFMYQQKGIRFMLRVIDALYKEIG